MLSRFSQASNVPGAKMLSLFCRTDSAKRVRRILLAKNGKGRKRRKKGRYLLLSLLSRMDIYKKSLILNRHLLSMCGRMEAFLSQRETEETSFSQHKRHMACLRFSIRIKSCCMRKGC